MTTSGFFESIDRGADALGWYWSVYYTWENEGEVFRFGSGRVYEDYLPEVENKDWLAYHTLGVIEYMIAQEIR